MRALPIVIEADRSHDDCHFIVRVGQGAPAQQAVGLAWKEMLGAVAALTHPEIRTVPYGLSKVRAAGAEEPPCVPRPAEPPEPVVTLHIPLAQADRFSLALASTVLWSDGFRSACGDAPDRWPPHVEPLREVRRLIRNAIAEVTGDEPEPLPF